VIDQQDLGQLAVKYFQGLLSTHKATPPADAFKYFSSRISPDILPTLETIITIDENMEALFSIPNDKALGPDGYTSLFFKRSWGILGSDFIDAVKYFFELFTLPRCVNATRIALVPKVENHVTMNDFRPISYCNVMYKCISKVIVSRL